MYDDLGLYIKAAKDSLDSDSIEPDMTMLSIYYKKLTKHIDELYVLVRENYSFIVKMEKMQGINEKQFIEIIGGILSEAANTKDTIEKILKKN